MLYYFLTYLDITPVQKKEIGISISFLRGKNVIYFLYVSSNVLFLMVSPTKMSSCNSYFNCIIAVIGIFYINQLIFIFSQLIKTSITFNLQKTRDKSTCTNLAAVIHACIAPKSGKHL